MIDEIVGQAKERQLSGLKKGIVPFGSSEPNGEKETNVKLADIAGVGKMTATRLKKETLR